MRSQYLQVLRIHFQIIRIFLHHTTSFSCLPLSPNLLSTHNPVFSIHKPRFPFSKHEAPTLNPLELIEFNAFIEFISLIELIELIEAVELLHC